MKKTMIYILSGILTSFTLSAQTSPVRKTPPEMMTAISNEMNSLFSDTINEGEMTAEVNQKETSCLTRIINPSKKTYRHFCQIVVDVISELSQESEKCQNTCEVNFFSTNLDPASLTRSESQIDSCLELLSSGCD